MALAVQKFREIVFQMLYSYDFSQDQEKDMSELLMEELKVTKKSTREAYQRMMKIYEKAHEIDDQIRLVSREYQFDRISSVEKNILRLGIFEICYDESIPPKVAIAEAIRLCRKFGTPESAEFINAILDQIFKSWVALKSDSSPVNV